MMQQQQPQRPSSMTLVLYCLLCSSTTTRWMITTTEAFGGFSPSMTSLLRHSSSSFTQAEQVRTVLFMAQGGGEKKEKTSSSGDDDKEEEGECADEEECEIDWSQMPGMDKEENKLHGAVPTLSEDVHLQPVAAVMDDFDEEEEDEDDDDEVFERVAKKGVSKVDQLRLRLEMQWQMTEAQEECDVYRPESCGSEPCPDCKGKGVTPCRFCRGTTVLWLGSSFTACPVCKQGYETCRSCQGTGWVAEWTQLSPSTSSNKKP